jgi:hypothetical protein
MFKSTIKIEEKSLRAKGSIDKVGNDKKDPRGFPRLLHQVESWLCAN